MTEKAARIAKLERAIADYEAMISKAENGDAALTPLGLNVLEARRAYVSQWRAELAHLRNEQPRDKTDEWDRKHAKSRVIVQDKNGRFEAIDKASPSPARTQGEGSDPRLREALERAQSAIDGVIRTIKAGTTKDTRAEWENGSIQLLESALGNIATAFPSPPSQGLVEAAEWQTVYLAARYSRAPELRKCRSDLEAIGLKVVSRWIDGGHELTKEGSTQAHEAERVTFAQEDKSDLETADCVISFTEEPRKTTTRGGRHVEFGIALARKQHVIVIGHRENVFHCLPQVAFFPTWDECLTALRSRASDRSA